MREQDVKPEYKPTASTFHASGAWFLAQVKAQMKKPDDKEPAKPE